MAFNLAPFNQTAFNTGSESAIWLSVLIDEKVTPSVGTSLEAYLVAIANERINNGGCIGGNGVYTSGFVTETIAEGVTSGECSVIIGRMTASELIDGHCTIMSESRPLVIGIETITAEAALRSDVYLKARAEETITAEAVTDKETWLLAECYELVSSSATLETVDIEVCSINITLQPGQRLIVDARDYNVWIDGENALYAQAGAWIDEMTRDTSSISITAASGVSGLTASILYTEQYL